MRSDCIYGGRNERLFFSHFRTRLSLSEDAWRRIVSEGVRRLMGFRLTSSGIFRISSNSFIGQGRSALRKLVMLLSV